MDIFSSYISSISAWFQAHALRIVAIVAVAFLIQRLGVGFLTRVIRRAIKPGKNLSPDAEKRREDTLIRISTQTLRIFLVATVLLLVLAEFGANLLPVLTAAGIVGVALGLGGQYLIKDVLSGAFIILENQYRVGDVVRIGEVAGVVEDISLRSTVLRDLDGTVHHVSNGEIKTASNLTKNFSRVNLDVGVSYDADLEKVEEVINRTGKTLAEDPAWKDAVLSPPKFLFVDEFGDLAVKVKILGETKPLRQWDVAGELRKRIKIAFDREGIAMPHWTEPGKR
jgi:small-conductance mechanosensitive channel